MCVINFCIIIIIGESLDSFGARFSGQDAQPIVSWH